MKIFKTIAPAILIFAAGAFASPAAMPTAQTDDSPEIRQLLEETQAEAVMIKTDSETLAAFTRSKLSWDTFAHKLQDIKDHVNTAGSILAKLKGGESQGSEWQQAAIRRIEPLLKEMADNTTATINHLNENQGKVHMPQFQELVKSNYAASADLENLIRDYVAYANAKEDFERLSSIVDAGE
jgi:hypothetical protein